MPDAVRLRMLEGGYRVDVTAQEGPLTWLLEGCTGPAGSTCRRTPLPPPARRSSRRAHGGSCGWTPTSTRFALYDLAVTPKALVWQGGSATQALRLVQAGKVAHLTTWKGSSIYLDRLAALGPDRASPSPASLIDAVQTIEADGRRAGDGQVPVGDRGGPGVVPARRR